MIIKNQEIFLPTVSAKIGLLLVLAPSGLNLEFDTK